MSSISIRAEMIRRALPGVLVLAIAAGAAGGQGLSRLNRERGLTMVRDVRRDIEKHYYDATYRGLDLAAHFAKAERAVTEAASVSQMLAAIAQAVDDFGDSHTYFIPPDRNVSVDYGWTMMAVGNRTLIASVTPGTDAARQGLAAGDEVLQLNAFVLTRQDVARLIHLYRVIRPQKQQHLRIRTPEGVERELDVQSAVTPRRFVDLDSILREIENAGGSMRHRDHAIGTELLIWKLPAFVPEDAEIERRLGKARPFKTLILDLRGNGGGDAKTMLAFIGRVFDRDVTIGTVLKRSGAEPLVAKAKKDPFGGQLTVLVDSQSASAAEIVARVIQIERRGTIIGDRTTGKVMASEMFPHTAGGDSPFFYATSVTVMDLKMTDGSRLEGEGVLPDALVLPSATDLARGRDPVLAAAVRLAGATLTSEEAGRLWR